MDAAGEPNPLSQDSDVAIAEEDLDDVNVLARKRDLDDDVAQNIKCRKASVTSRQRSAVDGSSSARRRMTTIKRPRDAKFICEKRVSGKKCGRKFTQKREFEVHFRTHGKALYVCECKGSYARKDNMKKHLKSEKHRRKMAELEAEAQAERQLAISALSLSFTPVSISSSSPSWSSSESFSSAHLDVDYQAEFPSF
ncbi:hypothetical protein TWF694_003764 [Orbilia ellipsospora]|uniref:C2H2-type domain-containing protein n=1 Tax=Orbilia ellipsospora TaxID=2528407 RepID=A0AAV9WZ70_9PEZI